MTGSSRCGQKSHPCIARPCCCVRGALKKPDAMRPHLPHQFSPMRAAPRPSLGTASTPLTQRRRSPPSGSQGAHAGEPGGKMRRILRPVQRAYFRRNRRTGSRSPAGPAWQAGSGGPCSKILLQRPAELCGQSFSRSFAHGCWVAPGLLADVRGH
jgi:hypothetical protein